MIDRKVILDYLQLIGKTQLDERSFEIVDIEYKFSVERIYQNKSNSLAGNYKLAKN